MDDDVRAGDDATREIAAELLASPAVLALEVDAEGVVRRAAPASSALCPASAAALVGQPCDALDPPGDDAFARLAAALARGDALPTPRRVATASGPRDVGAVVTRRAGGGAALLLVGAATSAVDDAPAPGLEGLVGSSPAMRDVFERIRLAAASPVTVLLTGESGTGKELAARAIHALGERSDGPFVAINCSAIPESLLESELFGHAAGAFTGAVASRAGVFESASGGTLFLDEIGDVSPTIQVKLLRTLQEHEIVRVGERAPRAIDVRLVTATNRDLAALMDVGSIREDFYYRIRVFEIRMPPLRERLDDVPALASHLGRRIASNHGRRFDGIARDALDALTAHPWPGNVRELHNAIEHALVVRRQPEIHLADLPADVGRAREVPDDGLTDAERTEKLAILDALDAHGWNRTRTADALGISRVTLWKKIRRYALDEGVFKRATRNQMRLDGGGTPRR